MYAKVTAVRRDKGFGFAVDGTGETFFFSMRYVHAIGAEVGDFISFDPVASTVSSPKHPYREADRPCVVAKACKVEVLEAVKVADDDDLKD